MKHILLSLFLIGCCCVHVNAQQQSVAGPAGASYVGSLGYISYTIGEPVVGTVYANEKTILQGFENPRSHYKAFNDSYLDDQIQFSGVVRDNGNLLSWTISEIVAGAQYELLRSYDGSNFQTVTIFGDVGNSPTNILTFNHLDVNAKDGLAYYVVNRISVDNEANKSSIITLFRETYALTDNFTFEAYPNPVVDFLNLRATKGEAEVIYINLLEVSSRLLEQIKIDFQSNQTQIDLSNLRQGIYILSIMDSQGNVIGIERIRKAG